MIRLYRHELKKYFSSPSGLSALLFFAVVEGLFLWVFDDGLNLLDSGYATADAFFALTPWVLIFLTAACCAQHLSEERKNGTLILLQSLPLSGEKIIWAKFLGILSGVFVCLLSSLTYVFSLSQLAVPTGNLDWGALWGSYLGLFSCAAAFSAISLFASSLTSHSISAFFIALFMNLFLFYGLEGLGAYRLLGSWDYTLQQMGLYNHYETLSTGVLSLSDLLYFLGVIGLFLSLAIHSLKRVVC